MKRRTSFGLVALLLGPARTQAGWAQGEATATAAGFVRALGQDFATAVEGTSSEAERRVKLAPLIGRVVDIPGTARFCLGRFWSAATPEQQQRYVALFGQALVVAVAKRADTYSAGTSEVAVLPEVTTAEGVAVPTVIRNPGQPPVRITWVIDTAQRPFRILDVTAEGISLRQTLRSDYLSFLRQNNGDLELFLRTLQARTA